MNTLDTAAGVLIITHRTPRVIAELIRVFFLYWYSTDANHCLQITFERKPIVEGLDGELLDGND
jgi:hypothetical protein